ncbi:hypothetical protein J41TS12_50400 [Paenibacillus antibioticophila]|uniref:Uncharacterized protein n=1 Tax=Paenibacillus antibioticophila TaxID=1274374 RepID=A0A920CK62_9BACL|nr:hypothetical protein [Paenibacillus antibioticophila]GIO40179.1 hypothetical protein J41TS12_50400 [Paenibacillus antibioticophila]
MIRIVTFKNWRYFGSLNTENSENSDALVLRRVENEPSVKLAFPFHEDTPNFDLSIPEALDLRNALDDVIGPIKMLQSPKLETTSLKLFPETFISNEDQSRLSGLLDRYPTDSEADRTARKALMEAMGALGLATGGREY